MTTEWESRVLTALRALEAAATPASAAATGSGPDLTAAIAGLGRLTVEMPAGTDPELAHFLQRRSYEKARQFLEGHLADLQRGGCTRTR
jgi:hypothetical protein